MHIPNAELNLSQGRNNYITNNISTFGRKQQKQQNVYIRRYFQPYSKVYMYRVVQVSCLAMFFLYIGLRVFK